MDELRVIPSEDLVVCHGDACAPNTLIDESGKWVAHVDLGNLGVGDRWADLAILTWSTRWNYGEGWEMNVYISYGIEPAWKRFVTTGSSGNSGIRESFNYCEDGAVNRDGFAGGQQNPAQVELSNFPVAIQTLGITQMEREIITTTMVIGVVVTQACRRQFLLAGETKKFRDLLSRKDLGSAVARVVSAHFR